MIPLEHNYYSAASERVRLQCGVDPQLSADERFRTWLTHWTVTTEVRPRAARKQARVAVRIECDRADVAGTRCEIEGWTRHSTMASAHEVARRWLQATYADAYAPNPSDVSRVDAAQLFTHSQPQAVAD